MKCQDRDPDLLLFGLGEMPFLQRWRLALHLRSCARCRARQTELSRVSGQIAAVLRPPTGGGGNIGRGAGSGLPASPAMLWLAALVVVLVLGLLSVLVVRMWPALSHPTIQRTVKDQGCRPDLPSDQCR